MLVHFIRVAPDTYAADYPYHWKIQWNDNTPATYASSASLNYTGEAFTCDCYTDSNPFWSLNSNRYQGWGYVTNTSGGFLRKPRKHFLLVLSKCRWFITITLLQNNVDGKRWCLWLRLYKFWYG